MYGEDPEKAQYKLPMPSFFDNDVFLPEWYSKYPENFRCQSLNVMKSYKTYIDLHFYPDGDKW